MRKLVFSSRWSKVKQAMEDIDWQISARLYEQIAVKVSATVSLL